jgi:hypothetical protein
MQQFHAYDGLRERYIKYGLYASVVVGVLGGWARFPDPVGSAVSVANILYCGACLAYLARGGSSVAAGKATALAFALFNLVSAVYLSRGGWPINLYLVPAVIAYSFVVASVEVAGVVTGAAFLTVLSGLALGIFRAEYAGPTVSNWIASALLIFSFVRALSRAMVAAGGDHARATDALEMIGGTVEALKRMLSRQVAEGLDEFEGALARSPEEAKA